MKILDDDLRVRFDPDKQEIRLYRTIEGGGDEVLHTAYPLASLKGKGFSEAGRLVGEDILLALRSTRNAF
jgi:hypothetical protein